MGVSYYYRCDTCHAIYEIGKHDQALMAIPLLDRWHKKHDTYIDHEDTYFESINWGYKNDRAVWIYDIPGAYKKAKMLRSVTLFAVKRYNLQRLLNGKPRIGVLKILQQDIVRRVEQFKNMFRKEAIALQKEVNSLRGQNALLQARIGSMEIFIEHMRDPEYFPEKEMGGN